MNNTPPNGPGNQPWGQPGQDPQQWGQQPPAGQQQWGQQPPTGQQQWGQQPPSGQQQWGQQPPPGQWGPQGPGGEPPKKKTGLIIGAIVAALILIGGGVAAAVILTGDDDKDGKKADEKTSQSVDPTDEPTVATTEPTEEPSDDVTPAPDGDSVTGAGYTFTLPDGWIDASDDPGAAGTPSIDTVAAWGSELNGSRANMIVETQAAGSASGPEDLKETWITTMTQATGGATPEEIGSISVDGAETIGVRFERDNGSGVQIVQIAHLLVEGDTAYAITLSFRPDDESEVTGQFDEIISSWSFD